MSSNRGWRLALAGCVVFVALGCSDPASNPGGSGGSGGSRSSCVSMGGLGGVGGDCTTDAINACLDLQNCCLAILVNPVFFEACRCLALLCDEQKCLDALAGYPYPECMPEPEPDGGVGGGGGSADP